ncbi:multidrug effflux MFS transporter [Ciceribacter sp. L1K23]|uniref:multidrug effflux MFS transporter n=1 Tax=Ciceribacter sp. L1K23 TaxID=2820276 RepID=UPI001B84261A|nr:multidrug effflux MFS transporter [Ciceribacter sp. L1K23]MBR0555235.1 multidrug effflux MFS transporter [Ciceribacter sp. L1K23]
MTGGRFLDRRTPPHILTLVLIAGLSALTMNIFLPSLPEMARHFGVDYSVMQFAVSGYLTGIAILQLGIGPFSDRFGRRPTMILGIVVFLFATLLCIMAPSVTWFMVGRLLQTTVVAGMVLSRAIVRDMVPMEEAASMIGYVTMGMTIVPMIGPTVGGVLSDVFGWQANFIALGVAGLIVLALVVFDLGETNRQRSTSFMDQVRAWPQLLLSPHFWGFTLTATLTSGAFFAFLGGAPFIGSTILKLSPSVLGMQFFFVAGGYLIGNFLSGRYTRRFGIPNMMLWGALLSVVGTVIPLVLLVLGFHTALSFFGPLVLVGLGNGLTLPSANAGMVSVRPHLAGSASGLGGAITMAGGAMLSALASAILTEETGALPLLIVMLLCSLAAIGSVLYLRRLDAPA